MKNKIFQTVLSLPRKPILFLIRFYQKTLSPDHGFLKKRFPNGYCRFYPSCSEYGYQIIKKRGLVVGSFKTIWRILRCNPLGKGGMDLP
jgi:putative membrane protein insertion efficiency factor